MSRTLEEAERRIAELEDLIRTLRHDVNGAITAALLIADGLRGSGDARTQRAGERIGDAVLRTTSLLKATRGLVPPRGRAVQ